jgi:predicted dienelactone hydrolase
MKAIWDNLRAVDLLESLPQVDPQRIGCIGHSLGGHNTMFTAAFDPRIKAMASNCGFTRFHKYYEGKLAGWTSARYMPLIASRYENNPDKVPFDFPEIVATFAPRPFLASAPLHDSNFEVSGVKETIAAATPIYALFVQRENLQANYPDCAHDFPEDVRKVVYEFFDKHLKVAAAK